MKTALIYPPTADPTAPYLALPALAGFLRSVGEEVVLIDANVEAHGYLLRPEALARCQERVHQRFSRLRRKAHLGHREMLAYPALAAALDPKHSGPARAADALALFKDRGGARFFDPRLYEIAVADISAAMRLISAAFTPLVLDSTRYQAPFSLLSLEEIERDARPEANPFFEYYQEELIPRLVEIGARIVGLSVAFPGQIQPAYSLALQIRRQLPAVHLTVGGPAITQILLRLSAPMQAKALGPFDSAVRFEGEFALLELVRQVARGGKPAGIIDGLPPIDLADLPAPDYGGLPLDQYLSPEPVLPYDPSRGCYWGRCAFCHYGLAEHGTAGYRERPLEKIMAHLESIQRRWGNRVFYFSHDTMSPNLAERVARGISAQKMSCRWATDMRPERDLTPELCATLAAGGALGVSLGIETAAPRLLEKIHKGVTVPEMATAIRNLARAGIAVEAMCFTDFPTESLAEARTTVRFLGRHRDDLALFVCGRFGLVGGARIAREPREYGIKEIWRVAGDEFIGQLFYEEEKPGKSDAGGREIDRLLDRLARGWWLHRYPWAGSLSTAHTLLWYERSGPMIFKQVAINRPEPPEPAPHRPASRIPPKILAAQAREAEIWEAMIYQRREVSRRAYRELLGEDS